MKEPRLPEVGEYVRPYGRLVEIEDSEPVPPPPKDYIFEETSARVEGRINGKVIKTYGTFNDFYGEGTCVECAIKEAKVKAEWLGPSDMVFVVVKITSRVRMRPTRHANICTREFTEFASLEFGCKRDLPDDVEEDVWFSNKQEQD